mmetsp:Transcript_24989/g.94457  ORF Transcript_24989/g.94457 Transcript_24989/m.94457 type:complete len:203 (-) Transcript_24989:805-1413(-)
MALGSNSKAARPRCQAASKSRAPAGQHGCKHGTHAQQAVRPRNPLPGSKVGEPLSVSVLVHPCSLPRAIALGALLPVQGAPLRAGWARAVGEGSSSTPGSGHSRKRHGGRRRGAQYHARLRQHGASTLNSRFVDTHNTQGKPSRTGRRSAHKAAESEAHLGASGTRSPSRPASARFRRWFANAGRALRRGSTPRSPRLAQAD